MWVKHLSKNRNTEREAKKGYMAMLERNENKKRDFHSKSDAPQRALEQRIYQKTKKSQDGEGTKKIKLVQIPAEGRFQD